MALLDYPDPEDLARAGPVVDEITSGRGQVPNVYRMLLHSPGLVAGWVHLANEVRFSSTVGARQRELSILLVAHLTDCAYERHHHSHLALDAGVTAAEVDAVQQWPDGGPWVGLDAAVLEFTAAMVARTPVPASALAELEAGLGAQGVVELAATVAYYLGLAHLLVTLDIEVEAP